MKNPAGSFGWADLTVENADQIRDFYANVIGYSFSEVDMGGYSDFCMNSPDDGQTKTGICFARGSNSGLPPVWLIYFYVNNLDESLEKLVAANGKIISGPKNMGSAKYAIVQDPAGAYCALYQE
ncbi:MAG: VOC family protein [Saprospiraceae bacterium]|nr:VOC family protein [Saprospiraceae bacterium]